MHDKYGNALKEGDEVLVLAKVVRCDAGEEYCNIMVETIEPMFPGDSKTNITLNSKQVMKSKKNKKGLPVPLGETLGPGKTDDEPDDDEDDVPIGG